MDSMDVIISFQSISNMYKLIDTNDTKQSQM